jgi:hypothetical protein
VAEAAHEMALLDLVVGIFNLLEHTPVEKMGLNRAMHFSMPSIESWNHLGHRLAPKDPWTGIVDEPGMLAIIMVGKRHGSRAKSFQVKVNPSPVVLRWGIAVETNEHFEKADGDGLGSMMVLLRECWRDAQDYAKEAARSLVSVS